MDGNKNTLTVEKVSQKSVGYFCNFQKTAQSKQSPLGENSPNLVTLPHW
jgi:hypothetical protein